MSAYTGAVINGGILQSFNTISFFIFKQLKFNIDLDMVSGDCFLTAFELAA
ncbi:MAG: hypothetical protein GXP21_00185 [Gammaproteobacteria bacterium]|nr:hypothetical protein [Gammaproteobacteria bacterium]